MYSYPFKLQRLINEVSKLPGVGPKMAERIAVHIMKKDIQAVDTLALSVSEIKELAFCTRCFNVSDGKICAICADDSRNKSLLCVVESPEDVLTVERTGKFRGYYHVLHGLLNPLNNIMPSDLKLKELGDKLSSTPEIEELILALNHTVEGDATSLYAASLSPVPLKITRLAKGLPTGSDIRYADEVTLGQAIIERREMKK